jgi:hypothetical protein
MLPLAKAALRNDTKGDELCVIDEDYFDNGMPNIKIHLDSLLAHVGKTHVIFFSSYRDLKEKYVQQSIIFVLSDTTNVTALTIVDLYDPLATMERIQPQDEGRIASANVDAHWWNTLPRKVHRILFDHHTLHNRFYFTGGNTDVHFDTTMSSFFANWKGAVAFPDEGAYKRFASFFQVQDKIVCAKRRDGDRRVIVIQEGDPNDKDILILDDLVRTGGTLAECTKALKVQGAKTVSIFVPHAEFPKKSYQRFINMDELERFYVTDTVPYVSQQVMQYPKFKVFTVMNRVNNILKQIEAQH